MLSARLRTLDAHPRARDTLVAVVWLLLGLAALQLGASRLWGALVVWETNGLAFLLLLIAISAIATQRSRHPFPALGAGTLVAATDVAFGGSLGVVLAFTDLLYAAFKYGSDRALRLALWPLAAAAALAAVAILFWQRSNVALQIAAAQWAIIILVAAMWGWNVRSERLRTRAAMAEQHARAAQQLRQRIAYDLHDLVANQIAVSGLHVEAIRLELARAGTIAPDVERSLDRATHGTDEAARQLHRMILMLRTIDDLDEHAELTVPRLLDEAFEGFEAQMPHGRRLLWRDGGSASLRDAVLAEDPGSARLILRVLQELVTNAIKHGRGDVEIALLSSAPLAIEVTNEIALRAAVRAGSGIGMTGAELLLGGTGIRLVSGPSGTARWRAALIPDREEAPRD